MSISRSDIAHNVIPMVSVSVMVAMTAAFVVAMRRRHRTLIASDDKEEEPTHSILHHFNSLQLDPESTVEEANKRRTASYYLKAREAHAMEIVKGVYSFKSLLKLRQQHMDRILRYSQMGTHSHRTVVVMCDASTAALLDEARRTILGPLNYSHEISTKKVWIPSLEMLPVEDLHITVAIPFWWHTMREGNADLTRDLAARFRQTLFLKWHHAFQVELQRIVLLGGQTLVALWRCVGERITDEGHVVYDRHGECVDPFVRLREEIVKCFTKQSAENRMEPLTYQDIVQARENTPLSAASSPARPTLVRQHSITIKTPGLGAGDGFIHTTLCRLPLECLSSDDVSLTDVHRLCREMTSTMSGHRMVISKFRFLETTGNGGQSNPCVNPIFDETIEAPSRFKVKRNGKVNEIANLHVLHALPQEGSANLTIGAIRNHVAHKPLAGLFDGPLTDRVEEKEEPSNESKGNDESPVGITAAMLI